MDLLRAVHEYLHGMDLQVFRVKLTPEPLQLLNAFFHFPWRRDDIASIDINRKFALLVHIAQTLVDPFMERTEPRDAGIKGSGNTSAYRVIDPPLHSRVNLLIAQFHAAIKNDRHFRGAFKHVSCHMPVLTHIIT